MTKLFGTFKTGLFVIIAITALCCVYLCILLYIHTHSNCLLWICNHFSNLFSTCVSWICVLHVDNNLQGVKFKSLTNKYLYNKYILCSAALTLTSCIKNCIMWDILRETVQTCVCVETVTSFIKHWTTSACSHTETSTCCQTR